MKTANRRSALLLCALIGVDVGAPAALAGCRKTPPSAPAPATPLDPDRATDAVEGRDLAARLGPVPRARKPYRIGVVVKFLGNEYWQLLARGMQSRAEAYGLTLDVQGASTEADRASQLAAMERMIERRYDALLVSPQTDENLASAVQKARRAGIPIVNVDDAVIRDAEHFVGPNQYQNGATAARYVLERSPQGAQVAVIEGQAGGYAAKQRTAGFKDTLAPTGIKVVASLAGDWDLQKSLELAAAVLEKHPDLRAFYCNNDVMALGVVEALHRARRLGQVVVIGTDGISPAHESIRAGELTATVDSFPFETGAVAVEVALRLLEGQAVPRVVYSPQRLVTRDALGGPPSKGRQRGAPAAGARP